MTSFPQLTIRGNIPKLTNAGDFFMRQESERIDIRNSSFHLLGVMDFLNTAIQHPFTWGLIIGLLLTAFVWKAGFSARRHVTRDLKRVEEELKNLQTHLNTQLKINASGNGSLQSELESLRQQNETLRVNAAALQQKPGRAELRLLQVQEIAIRAMREQAPGFAAAWEKAVRQGESEVDAAESGLVKLVRRVIPSLGSHSSSPPISTTDEFNIQNPNIQNPRQYVLSSCLLVLCS